MADRNIRVFVSYAWGPRERMDWVLRLASRLEEQPDLHVDFDQWDVRIGTDVPYFMERLKTADRVVVVCTPDYVEKVNERRRGAGYEGALISAQLVEDAKTDKFLPVILQGRGRPTCLESKAFCDFNDDAQFEDKFNELLGAIRGESVRKRPTKRPVPANASFAEVGERLAKSFSTLTASTPRVELRAPGSNADQDVVFIIQNDEGRPIVGAKLRFTWAGFDVESRPIDVKKSGVVRERDLSYSNPTRFGRYRSFRDFLERNPASRPALVTLQFSQVDNSEGKGPPVPQHRRFRLSFHQAHHMYEVSPEE